jgi:LIM homeobox protein 1
MLTAYFQVWFQNKRSKERRLKQLTSMGRGPFFGNSRKMRGFPMNLSPGGLDEAPPGFPYFTTADGKFEFGYGAPGGFHHEFFAAHHPHQGPPGQPLPFNTPGEKKVTISRNGFRIERRITAIKQQKCRSNTTQII